MEILWVVSEMKHGWVISTFPSYVSCKDGVARDVQTLACQCLGFLWRRLSNHVSFSTFTVKVSCGFERACPIIVNNSSQRRIANSKHISCLPQQTSISTKPSQITGQTLRNQKYFSMLKMHLTTVVRFSSRNGLCLSIPDYLDVRTGLNWRLKVQQLMRYDIR